MSGAVGERVEVSNDVEYITYTDETMIGDIQRLVSRDLSEPYSIFTYRHFLHNWPELCICGFATNSEGQREMMATIVGKIEQAENIQQGYIAMLAVDKSYRNKGIGSILSKKVIERMILAGCHEVYLETEVSNVGALSLYSKLGFMKDDRMCKYYLNGGDAYRLKLWIERPEHTSRFPVSTEDNNLISTNEVVINSEVPLDTV